MARTGSWNGWYDIRGRGTSWGAIPAAVGMLFVAAVIGTHASGNRMSPRTETRPGEQETDSIDLSRACLGMADWLSRQLGPDACVVVHPPYVIGGDLAGEELHRIYRATVAPAARAITQQYLSGPPDAPTVIILARDEASYDRFARRLFGEPPRSSYGYYRPHLRTILVNRARGTSGLLHELTHAILAFESARLPEWFEEGLASLHEESEVRGGVPVGRDNWRLDVLQEAIRRRCLQPLDTLVEAGGFRRQPIGLSYAQARYFCLFLQERGLLDDAYRRVRQESKTDRQGTKILSLFGGRTWQQVDAEFRRWALNRKTNEAPSLAVYPGTEVPHVDS